MGGPTTVFVRNLPYTCTDAGLEAAFGEIGPVKEAFIVAEKGTGGASKGFGFVQFALAEDAAAAVGLSKTHKIDGRCVTIDIAKQKPSAKGDTKADGTTTGGGGGGEHDHPPPSAVDDGGAESDSDAPKTKAADASRLKTGAVSVSGRPLGGGAPGVAGAPRVARRKRGADDEADAAHPALVAKRAARSVAIAGLKLSGEPDGIDPEAAMALARQCGGVEEILSPAPKVVVDLTKLRHDGATRGVVIVVYTSETAAQKAVTMLHRAMPGVGKRKQQKVQARIKEGALGASSGGAAPEGQVGVNASHASASLLWARALGGCEGAKPKSWRVIIRNLNFKATDEDIRNACSKAGFVWDLTVPRDFHRKPKGFAFAAYTKKAHAEKAVSLVNGVSIAGRPVAVDWALSKHTYAEAKAKAEAEAEAAEVSDEEDEESGSEDGSDGSEDMESGSSGSESDEASSDDSDSDEDKVYSGSDDDSASDDGSGSDSDTDAAALIPVVAPTAEDDDMTRRVMLRVMDHPDAGENPAESAALDTKRGGTRREARELAREKRIAEKIAEREKKNNLKAAARAKEAHAVAGGSDSDSDAPPPLLGSSKRPAEPIRGASVFIRDVPAECTKNEVYEKMRVFGAVRSCRLVMDKATGRAKGTAFVDFHEMKGARSAVAASEAEELGGVKMAGRRLSIALAVSASEAADLATKRSKELTGRTHRDKDTPRDNRNLYLASEGVVHEEGPAARGVSQTDIQKRRRAKEEQAMKLKNPNFFISKTRLQVRNVPLEMDQKALKKVFFDAVTQRATKQTPRVLHAKLLFDPNRHDEAGNPKSRGIGFVEFAEHEHALVALRELNNNPTIFETTRRPIVEFAVEDARAVRKLERRRDALDKAQRDRVEASALDGLARKAAEDGKKTRGQKRRTREKDGDETSVKKPWANKQKKTSGVLSGDAGGTDGGVARVLSDGGVASVTTGVTTKTPSFKKETKKRAPPVTKPKPANEKPAGAAKQSQKRARDDTPHGDGPSEKSRRGLATGPEGRRAKGERRDKTDDLVDRYVATGATPAGDTKKRIGGWAEY